MSYSDTTLDRRLQPMSPRPDLSSSSSKEFRPGGGGSSRFHPNRTILSLSDIADREGGRGGGSPSRRNLLHNPPPSSRSLNHHQRLSNRFSSATTSSMISTSSSRTVPSRTAAMGGVMAAASNTEPPITFWPPDANWQKMKAKLLGLDVQHSHWFAKTARRRSFPSDCPPKTCETVAGDGNCLFRAFSFWVTGSEDFHIEVRDVIVQEIHSNARLYSAVTSTHSITNYLRESQMSEEGVWGSEVEIFVAATLLQTPIAVYAAFGDRHLWQVFRPLRYHHNVPRERCMLYLQNSNNHFEPVIDV